ncbi:hypothetical protein BDZ97DRAFT_2071499 [Flammula alnicola]|nr:hypothetical protein BDZ97DRAFT_2071499 [Flammula alnicola]
MSTLPPTVVSPHSTAPGNNLKMQNISIRVETSTTKEATALKAKTTYRRKKPILGFSRTFSRSLGEYGNGANFVIATTRNVNTLELQALAAKNPKSLKLPPALLPNGLDYLVNNAGKNLQPTTRFEDLNLDEFADEMTFSTVTPPASPITFLMAGQFNAYSVAKAALNILAHKWAATLKYDGVTAAALHPGKHCLLGEGINEWMAKYAPQVPHFPPEAAADNVIKISEALTLEKTGAFWHFDGTNLPW